MVPAENDGSNRSIPEQIKMGGLLGYITVAKPKSRRPPLQNAQQGLGKSNNFLGFLFDTKNEILCIMSKKKK